MSYPKKIPVAVIPSTGTTAPEPLLVPVPEAARLLSLSEYSIRRLCRKDQLKYKKLSPTKWLVTTASIRKFASAGV
jgi:hypothetical protein